MSGLENLASSQQKTKDGVGSHPSIIPIPKIRGFTLRLLMEPSVYYTRSIGNSWIAGSSTNAIVGTWTGTVGGSQLIVGDSSNTETLVQVRPKDNFYYNFLRATSTNTSTASATYGLLLSASTGTVDTTNFRIDMDNAEVIEWIIFKDAGQTVRGATVILDTDSSRTNMTFGTNVALTMSADGGSNYESVTNNVEHTFTNTGSELRLRLTASANSLYWKTANTSGKEVAIRVAVII